MNRQKAIKEYLTSQSLVGKNYENSTIEMIIKKGLKYEISIFQNEALVKKMIEESGVEISDDFDTVCEILKDLIECEKDAQMSKD